VLTITCDYTEPPWYGPVCQVVWEGGAVRLLPIPIVAAPALVATYAVLTRLPPPYRLSPTDARTLLEENFISTASIVPLDKRAYLALLRRAPQDGIVGGRTYDAVIAACARKGKIAVILTSLNLSYFVAH
jgi:predicted nucleic acid-binding protein